MNYVLIRESFPIARKAHQCIWCGEMILPGKVYRRELSRFAEVQNFAWHIECFDSADFSEGPEFAAYENERPQQVTRNG